MGLLLDHLLAVYQTSAFNDPCQSSALHGSVLAGALLTILQLSVRGGYSRLLTYYDRMLAHEPCSTSTS